MIALFSSVITQGILQKGKVPAHIHASGCSSEVQSTRQEECMQQYVREDPGAAPRSLPRDSPDKQSHQPMSMHPAIDSEPRRRHQRQQEDSVSSTQRCNEKLIVMRSKLRDSPDRRSPQPISTHLAVELENSRYVNISTRSDDQEMMRTPQGAPHSSLTGCPDT